ncbi:hypothetical protein PoB_005942900 [Plakobranchus ocellatus]|uniref:Uncharacterized protein n=1 Tax=Plakobranchus ocellatus TaxID=259542 RepID=A0AAV4CN90_9GAST|nr:hypothetical protein PoB_005942900 [Plakobranchus ocellatus]
MCKQPAEMLVQEETVMMRPLQCLMFSWQDTKLFVEVARQFEAMLVQVFVEVIDTLRSDIRTYRQCRHINHTSVMMVFRGSAEILGFGSEEEFPRFPRFRWLPRLQLNKRAMIRGVLRNENLTTCGRDDNFIDMR